MAMYNTNASKSTLFLLWLLLQLPSFYTIPAKVGIKYYSICIVSSYDGSDRLTNADKYMMFILFPAVIDPYSLV